MSGRIWLVALVAAVALLGTPADANSFMTVVVVDHVGPDLQWFADMLTAYDADNPFSDYYGLLVADPTPVTHAFQGRRAHAEGADQQVAAHHLRHTPGLGLTAVQTVALADHPAYREVTGGPVFTGQRFNLEWRLPEIGVARY